VGGYFPALLLSPHPADPDGSPTLPLKGRGNNRSSTACRGAVRENSPVPDKSRLGVKNYFPFDISGFSDLLARANQK
jgi:hypothetical protein